MTGIALMRELWTHRELLAPVLKAIKAVASAARITIEVRKRKADGVQPYDIISVDAQDLIDGGLEEIEEFENRRGKSK